MCSQSIDCPPYKVNRSQRQKLTFWRLRPKIHRDKHYRNMDEEDPT